MNGADWYLLQVHTQDEVLLCEQWYSAPGNYTGTTCNVTPDGLNLLNGSYKWHIQDYGAYGFGTATALQVFTLNLP